MDKNLLNKHVYKNLLLILLFFATITYAPFGYSFSGQVDYAEYVNSRKVTIKLENVSLKRVLDVLRKESGLNLLYEEDRALSTVKLSNINFEDATVSEVLDYVLFNTSYTYKITDSGIAIMKQASQPQSDNRQQKVTGHILDEDGQPIVGATILSTKNPKVGSISERNGRFTITTTVGDILEISYTGKLDYSFEVKQLQDDKPIIITLKTDELAVEDVFVTGYGNIKAHENVGAITRITSEDLMISADKNLNQMLQGKIAGMVVINTSGAVGSRQSVKVRGTSTLLGNQEPVWVVDGIIQEDPLPFEVQEFNALGGGDVGSNIDQMRNFVGNAIAWLNPNDINDITVLKDASATAIYGVKAANGVIVITTKRGKAGRTNISYSTNMSFSFKTNYDKLHLMNSAERLSVSREIIEQGYYSVIDFPEYGYEGAWVDYMLREISAEEFNRLADYYEEVNTNWFDLLMRNPFSNSHSVSISGGNNLISYYTSINASMQNGQDIYNGSQNYGINLSVNGWLVEDKVSFSARVSGSYNVTKGLLADAYGYATETSRNMPAVNPDGTRFFYEDSDNSGYLYNFENERDNGTNTNSGTNINGAFNLKWRIMTGLDLSADIGYGVSNSVGRVYKTELTNYIAKIRGYEFGEYTPDDLQYHQSKLPHGGELTYNQTGNVNYTVRTQLAYNKVFNEKHRLSSSLGVEMRSNSYDGYTHSTYGYIHDRGRSFVNPPLTVLNYGDVYNENSLYNNIISSTTDRISNYMSLFYTGSYSYKERYVFSATVRSDASNRFGQDARYRFLPVFSFGGRWNVAEEEWMKNQDVINNLSLRASYGWQGNVAENFGPELIANIIGTPHQLTGDYYLTIKSLPYENLRWEKVKSYNLGLDFGMFKNKFMVSLNSYFKRTVDMIVNLDVPHEFGVSAIPINGGNMSNGGWDVSVSTTLIRNKNLTWSISANTSQNFNLIESELEPVNSWNHAVAGSINKQGYPYSTIWAFEYLGVDGSNGAPLIYRPEANVDGVNAEDATTFMTEVGKLEPDFTGGISTSVRYKSFAMSTSFTLNLGSTRFLAPYVTSFSTLPHPENNMSRMFNDRWQAPGDELDPTTTPGIPHSGNLVYQSIATGSSAFAYNFEQYNKSTDRVASGNFLTCNGLSLSYTLPKPILDMIGINNCSVSMGASNLFKIVSKDYKGIDPEVALGNTPLLRSYNVGISITL